MKHLYFLFFLLSANIIIAQGPDCAGATPFCSGPAALIFPNTTGQPNGNQIACLGSQPNAAWFYLQVGNSGNLQFSIVQNTAFDAAGNPTGTGLDVDYVAWGPFGGGVDCSLISLADCPTCPNNTANPAFYPFGNIVDCSYDGAFIETLTINNAIAGQVYVVLITNFSGAAGFIKLVQTNSGSPGAGTTNCDIVCGFTLGNDENLCGATDVTLTANEINTANPTANPVPVTGVFTWTLNGVPQPAYTTGSITVNQSGTWAATAVTPGCVPFTDTIEVTLNNPPALNAPVNLTGAAGVCNPTFDLNSVIAGLVSPNPVSDYFYSFHTDQGDSFSGINPILNPSTYTITSNQTIYIYITPTGPVPCADNTQFNLIVNCSISIGTLSDIVQCDIDNSGDEIFNLTGRDTIILNGQTPASNYTISYHTSLADATSNSGNGLNPIPAGTLSAFTSVGQTIWVRIQDNTTPAPIIFTTTSFQLVVNALPTITGTLTACAGFTTQLTGSGTANATTPWTSSNTAVATVNNTGLVTGVAAGTTTITYTNNNGCIITASVTINAAPTITGGLSACVGLTTQLTGSGTPNATSPWTSSNTAVATVNTTGLVTGLASGTTVITYTDVNGCTDTETITINALPTISGTLSACIGLTTQLTGSPTANAVNPWVSATPAVATISNTGLVTGISVGTSVITYTNTNGCIITATVTINALPTISGTLTACAGLTTQLTGSGTANTTTPWSSSNTAVATVNTTGLVTGVASGTTVITYTDVNGCTDTETITINALPTISGTLSACIGLTTQLTGSPTANAVNPWVSATPAVATISNTGLVTGISVGTSVITYTNTNSCIITATVTINALPTITGTLTACAGFTTQLTGSGTPNATTPWTSSNTAVATVNNTGLVTGVAAGTTTITYTNNNGCIITASVTINAAPTITGGLSACVGLTTQLTGSGTPNATSPWTSSNTAVATVNTTGLVTGLASGTTVITYTDVNGCTDTETITINALPTISGTLSACIGLTTQLTGSPTANAVNPWVSATPAVATISNTGLVTGISVGTSVITYTNTNGCIITATVTINALPTISGTLTACAGLTTQLTGSGTANTTTPWSSSNTAVATVNTTGLVTGVASGTTVITYTDVNGCTDTETITINALPTISGTLSACIGLTTQLTGSPTANAVNPWVSATPAVATISNTGLVTGISVGTSVITYTNTNSCIITATVTINALPTITGTLTACAGFTTQLTGSGTPNATTPWTSSNTAVATVNNTGLVTGVAAGTTTITYTNNNGCIITASVTINAAPTITGGLSACVGLTTQLTGSGTPNATSPWTSSNTAVATVNTTGLVTGLASGTTVITYTDVNGCTDTETITINALPTISGTLSACIGLTTQLTGSPTANAVNPWVSATPAVATISNTGLVTGISVGTSVITYTNTNGCIITATVTINALPTISGTLTACAGLTTQLTGSGTANTTTPWSSSNTAVATVNTTGLVTGVASGTTVITYTDVNGCTDTETITINALPTISGTLSACIGLTTQLTGSPTANAVNPWVSATPAVATISNTGLVTGISVGTSVITYTNTNSCIITATVTINALPTITGTLTACAGFTTQLTGSGTANATTPWTSSNTAVATVNNTGLVTGVAAGTTTITYTNNNGCIITASVTINAAPTITGGLSACVGLTTQLTGSGTPNATSPWTSSNTAVATVNTTGLVTGLASGTTVITYTDVNGCTDTETIAIVALPEIPVLNPGFVCVDKDNNPIGSHLLNTTLGDINYTYVWSNITSGTPVVIIGETSSTYLVTAPGQYSVVATANPPASCVSIARTVTVPASLPPISMNIVTSQYFSDIQSLTVTVSPVGNYEYQINNSGFQSSNIFTNVNSGSNTIEVRDINQCGIIAKEAFIIDYPKFFTPNGDGYHDTWNIYSIEDQTDAKILIFDRFGKLIKQIMPSQTGWNGTFNSEELPSTDYWFVVTYKEDGVQKELRSHFALKR